MLGWCAGAEVIVDPGVQLNISMDFINVPAAPKSPVIQMRVDYWDDATSSYPAANSFKFYQSGTTTVTPQPCAGLSMWGGCCCRRTSLLHARKSWGLDLQAGLLSGTWSRQVLCKLHV